MSDEEWRKVRGWPGYQVSDLGRVRSTRRKLRDGRYAGGVILTPELGRGGYLQVTLSGGARKRKRHPYVHQLVAEAFIGKRPPGQQVRHGPNGKLDNRASELCYGTPADNKQDQEDHGTSGRALTAELAREIRDRYAADHRETHDSLAATYGVSRETIGHVLRGLTWDHVGGPLGNGQRAKPWAKPWAKLTDDSVRDILTRHAAGETARALSLRYGVTAATVGQVVRRETWRHVKTEGEEGTERENKGKEKGKEVGELRPLNVRTELGRDAVQ